VTRREGWLAVLLVLAAVLGHALLPRYTWHTDPQIVGSVRLDRWTGAATWIRVRAVWVKGGRMERRLELVQMDSNLQMTRRSLRGPVDYAALAQRYGGVEEPAKAQPPAVGGEPK
jgi:hypothetical protein